MFGKVKNKKALLRPMAVNIKRNQPISREETIFELQKGNSLPLLKRVGQNLIKSTAKATLAKKPRIAAMTYTSL